MKVITLIVLLFFYSVYLFAQNNNTHSIDKELEECLDVPENGTSLGMTRCVQAASEKWDAELNKNYKKLMSLLSEEQKEKLKTSQRQWIAYRDAEIEFSNKLYYDFQGSMWTTVAAQTKLDITKQRALDFARYIANINMEE